MDLNPEDSPNSAPVTIANMPSDGADLDVDLDSRSRAFAHDLVQQYNGQIAKVDEIVQSASRNWRLERMSRVDRNIIRLATSELLASPEVPVKVIINEAVELAKRYGAAQAPAFVNGILDRIAKGVRDGGDFGAPDEDAESAPTPEDLAE